MRARGWALADEELAPGVRSVAVPVRDGTGKVRAAMNVTVHAAETTTQRLLNDHLPPLLTTAGQISAEWAIWLSRPHVEIGRRGEVRPGHCVNGVRTHKYSIGIVVGICPEGARKHPAE